MTNWRDIAKENRKAAQLLGDADSYRSCVSRAYYAAFSAVTSALAGRVAFSEGRETPAHRKMTSLMSGHLVNRVNRQELSQLKAAVRRLYNDRLVADYRSGQTIDATSARIARSDAHYVCRTLGITE